ncbi:MAG: CHAP domain-containing protein [Gemmataceae bacterium]|nr:CHAP domain-containing protein [Gemmataceae bacterium]
MSAKQIHRFGPTFETLESRDGPSSFSLASYVSLTYSNLYAVKPASAYVPKPAYDISIYAIQTTGDRVLSFAQSNVGKTVKFDVANYGNEQCTDLVRAALKSAGAKNNDDYGTTGANADYVWGTLAMSRTVSNGVIQSAYGNFSSIKAGDIIQFRNVGIHTVTGNSWSDSFMGHHSAIVKSSNGLGQITVLEQNSNGHHYVEEHTYNLANMTGGTVWVYHPQAK